MTSSKEHDNTNRGALWPMAKKASSGTVDVDGHKCSAYFLCMDNPKGNMPTHRMFIDYRDGSVINVALWRPDKEGSKAVLSGQCDTHWVHIFRNTNEAANAPAFDVKLSPKDDAPPKDAPAVSDDDELNDLF